jgi:hypothetical protein
MASRHNVQGNPIRYAVPPAVEGVDQTKHRDNNMDCDTHLSTRIAGADSPVAASAFANSDSGINSRNKRTPKRVDVYPFDSPPMKDVEFKFYNHK